MKDTGKQLSTWEYLRLVGVEDLPPLTHPLDPGYDPATAESHIEQSSHLMAAYKLSTAAWLVASEAATRRKIAAARAHNVPTVTGGTPFEVAVVQNKLELYLDICAGLGISRIECAEGFTEVPLQPHAVVQMARERGLEIQYEMGKKQEGAFTEDSLDEAIARGKRWLDAGAKQVVVEARESARGVGMFDNEGNLNRDYADRFAREFGFETAIFEAPNKASQFAFLNHFGRRVQLSNVRLEEILRVEIYRRGMHADAYLMPHLRPNDTSHQTV